MKIFPVEIKDRISELLEKSCAHVECKFNISKDISFETLIKELTLASDIQSVKDLIGQDQPDLAFIVSILVSAGWNLNDDVFTPAELWKARYTPKHKPINNEHDDAEILGHIIESKAVDKTGKEIILTESDTLPEQFDIEVAGVLYKSLPKIKDKVNALIEKANNGELFVSMECWFDDLAYAVQDKSTGNIAIVERKEDTAFLTKYLRVYGGTGEYKGYKVGRVLKNIVFGGQGLVKNPANPESVIKVAANLSEGGMNMDKEIAKQLEDALASVAERDKKIESLTKDLEGAKSASNIYETKVKEVDQKIEELLSQLGKATETIKASEVEKTELTKKLEEVTAEYNKVKAEVDAINKANKTKERVEKLSKVKTLTEAEAKEVADMSDETFNTVLKYASVNPVKQETEASVASLNVEVKDDVDFQGGDDNIEDKSAQVALATAKCLLGVKEGGEK